MRERVASLPAATMADVEVTPLAAAKLAAADIGGKGESKSESVGTSRFSSVDSFDTLLSPPSASPPSTPGRSDQELQVIRRTGLLVKPGRNRGQCRGRTPRVVYITLLMEKSANTWCTSALRAL